LELVRSFGAELLPGRWQHEVVDLEVMGRVRLPAGTALLAESAEPVRAVSRGFGMVLRRGGVGAPVRVDGRRRLGPLPAWFRRLCEPAGSVLVAVRRPDTSVVVMAPTGALDALVDQVVGEVR
jgi:hypothetical protein